MQKNKELLEENYYNLTNNYITWIPLLITDQFILNNNEAVFVNLTD